MASKEDSPNDPNAKDDIYEVRPMAKKIIRIITVVAYLVSVSFVAIVLSAYYIFLWHPPPGGSLSLRDPQAEYLMESPPQRTSDNRSINEILKKINSFRENPGSSRRLNKTKSPTISSLHDGSKDVGYLRRMMAMIRRNHSWRNPDTLTGVYDTISKNKLEDSFNMTRIDVSTTLENLNDVSEPSTVGGEEYIADSKDIQQNSVDTSGGIGDDVDGSHREAADDHEMRDDYNETETTSSEEIKEKTTVKSNATDSSHKPQPIYPPVYIDEDQPIERPTELEASLDPLPTIIPTSSEYQEEISEENIEEPLDIEFDGDNLPRR